jgi:hypothetical protein
MPWCSRGDLVSAVLNVDLDARERKMSAKSTHAHTALNRPARGSSQHSHPLGGDSFLIGVSKLAAIVQKRWENVGYQLFHFTDIAVACLAEHSLHKDFREEEILNWVNTADVLPGQLDSRSSFGQPPITVWSNEKFVIDIYFWIDAQTNIHNHGFAGAFVNLLGDSLQFTYNFTKTSCPIDGLSLGSLFLDATNYCQPGVVQPIFLGPQLIHSVWHLNLPTITLVVRTKQDTGVRQSEYYQSGAALQSRPHEAIEWQRRLEFLCYLFHRKHPQREKLATLAISAASPLHQVWLLQECFARPSLWQSWSNRQEVISDLEAKHGYCIGDIVSGGEMAGVMKSVIWRNLTSADHRLLISLLCTYKNRDDIVQWITSRRNDQPWEVTVSQWVMEMIRDRALRTTLADVDEEVLSCLFRGLNADRAVAVLRGRFAVSRATANLIKEAYRELSSLKLFQPLLRDMGAIAIS